MKRLREELSIVPPVAWFIAVLAYFGLCLLLVYVTGRDDEMQPWPVWGKTLFCGLVPLPLTIYIVLIGYVNADARRRGMRYVLWTLLAIFIPNALGIILYFVLRDPLMTPCPGCATLLKHGYAFCPKCGEALGNVCLECRKPVESGWSHCASCGAVIPASR